jgi:Ca2+-transporting ATPase
LLNSFLIWRVVFVASLLMAPVYGLFIWLQQTPGMPIEVARSAAVNMLVVGELVYLLNTRRSLTSSLSLQGLFGSRPVLIAIGLVLVFQIAWTYAPPMHLLFGSSGLSASHWGLIWLAGIIIFLLIELEKFVWRRMGRTGFY